jgi:hypothetical protein
LPAFAKSIICLDTITLPFDNGERPLVTYPQKRPMIGQTSRPPQLETPFHVFNDGRITPNNAFFVRYHLAGVQYDLDPDKFTLEIKGKVDRPLKLSLQEIKKVKAVNPAWKQSGDCRTPKASRKFGDIFLVVTPQNDGRKRGKNPECATISINSGGTLASV